VWAPCLQNRSNRLQSCSGWEMLACSLRRDLRTWSSCWVHPITRA